MEPAKNSVAALPAPEREELQQLAQSVVDEIARGAYTSSLRGAYRKVVSPELVLATLLYVKQVEAKLEAYRVGHDSLCAALDESTARLSTVEAANAELAAKLEDERARHKVEVLDILRDMRLPQLTADQPVLHDVFYQEGQNKERQAINDYCRQKAYEYDPQGIGPDPTEVGQWDTRPAPAAPLLEEAVPAARVCDECGDDYDPNCITCKQQVGEPTAVFAPATALPTTGEGKEPISGGKEVAGEG